VRGPIRYDDVSFFLFYFIFVKKRKERADKNSAKINVQIFICTFFLLGCSLCSATSKEHLMGLFCLSVISFSRRDDAANNRSYKVHILLYNDSRMAN
jgi:hypothetical protein